MSGLIFNGVKQNGLIYNGKNYLSGGDSYIDYDLNITLNKSVQPSAGTENTSGYAATFSFITEPFKLFKYDNIFQPLTSLPTHKFVLNHVTQTPINDMSLIYNGDGTFSLSGTLPTGLYSSKKGGVYGAVDITVSLLDENNNFFVSNKQIFDISTSSSATTTNFTGTTLTYEIYNVTNHKLKQSLNLPESVGASVTNEERYITDSGYEVSETIDNVIVTDNSSLVQYTQNKDRKIY